MNAARQSSGERGRGARVARRVAAETGKGLALTDEIWGLRGTRAAVGADRVRLGRQRRTVDEIRVLAAALAIARGPCPVQPGGVTRFLSRGLTLINAATLAVVLGRLDGAPDGPSWLSAVLAIGVTGGQVRLAFDVGRRLSPFVGRETAAGLPPETVVEVGVLVGMGSLVGAASFRWATDVQDGGVGVVAGLVMAISALAAPLMIVRDEVYGPGPRGRMLARCERALGRVDQRCRRLGRRADRLFGAAQVCLRRAEELLVLAADLLGDDDPVIAALEAGVAELRSAIAELGGEPSGVVPLLDPDDLDLAG